MKSLNSLDILDVETYKKLKRVKTLGRGATSEVFEIIKEEHYALKVFYNKTDQNENESDDDVDVDVDKESKKKSNFDFKKMKHFLLDYEALMGLNHPNIIKAFGIFFGDSIRAPAILLEFCPPNL